MTGTSPNARRAPDLDTIVLMMKCGERVDLKGAMSKTWKHAWVGVYSTFDSDHWADAVYRTQRKWRGS